MEQQNRVIYQKLIFIIVIFFAFSNRLDAFQMDFEEMFHIKKHEAQKQFGDKTYHSLLKAHADFNSVLQGKKPIYAKLDINSPVPADGGTCFYLGNGYSLTVYKSLNDIHKGKDLIHGYIYGPSIYFFDDVISGNMPTISFLTFYRYEDLKKLLGKDY